MVPGRNLRLDLKTGEFSHTPRASRRVCGDPNLERPTEEGRISEAELAEVRAAFARAVAEGPESRACREQRRPEQIVVGNGGVRVLGLMTGAETVAAPDDLTCWSDSARASHHLIDRIFGGAARR